MPRSAARSERQLEGQPDARGHRVGVFRVACCRHTVENLGRVQRFPRCEVSTDDIERHVRGELRSEEHTSELQSRLHLVCRLLLEKKKKKPTQPDTLQNAPRYSARAH